MKEKILVILCCLFGVVSYSQVRPDNFTVRTAIDSSNTEFYSQKDGTPRRINLWTIRDFVYQSDTATVSNDTLYLSNVSTGVYLGALSGADQETIEDYVGAMFTGNSETGVTTVYTDDGANPGKIDLTVTATVSAPSDTITILAYGNSYVLNNSDSTSTGTAAASYFLDENIKVYDWRRDSIAVLSQDTALWGTPLNAPPQIFGASGGLGIDRFPRNTTWVNHFARGFTNTEDPATVFMLVCGKGGVGSDSLLYGPYWDSLQAVQTEAVGVSSAFEYYDYVFLGLGPVDNVEDLEDNLNNYRDSLFELGVIDERTTFVFKEHPSEASTNRGWNSLLPYLDRTYEWVNVVYGVKDSITIDGTHPTAAQLKTIGERAYRLTQGSSWANPFFDDNGNFAPGVTSLSGYSSSQGNVLITRYSHNLVSIDSIYNLFWWNPDSVGLQGNLYNIFNIGPNFRNATINDNWNIINIGHSNLDNVSSLRDSMIQIGWGNGIGTNRQFNTIGGFWNNPNHAQVDYVMSANQTSSATGDKFLFAGVNAANVIIGDDGWVFTVTDVPGDNEVLTFDAGAGTGSWEPPAGGTDDQVASEVDITDSGGYYTGTEVESALAEIADTLAQHRTDIDAGGGGGSDDQTLAEVLTEGNTAGTAIDMDGNNINNVGNLTIDATTNDFVFNGNGTTLEILVGGTERLSLTAVGILQLNDAISFPSADGTSGQVLKTDGAGSLTWQDDNDSGAGGGSTEYHFAAYDTSTTVITLDTYLDIPWENEIIKENSFTHSNSTNPEQITFDSTGVYIVTVGVILDPNTSNRIEGDLRLQIDTGGGFGDLPAGMGYGTLPYQSSTGSTSGNIGGSLSQVPISATAGDIIKVQVTIDAAGTDNSDYSLATGSHITIQRIQ